MPSRSDFLKLLFCCLFFPSLAFGQGIFASPQTALKTVNGQVVPFAGATITVCGANASGLPCSPALTNTIFRDAALTQPLTNPFFADSNGNYQFAAAPTQYTVTVTGSGFSGYSYQLSLNGGGGGGGSGNVSTAGFTAGMLAIATGTTTLISSNESEAGGVFIVGTPNGMQLVSATSTQWSGTLQPGTTVIVPATYAWSWFVGSDNWFRCQLLSGGNCLGLPSLGYTAVGDGTDLALLPCNTASIVAGDVVIGDGHGGCADSGTLLSSITGATQTLQGSANQISVSGTCASPALNCTIALSSTGVQIPSDGSHAASVQLAGNTTAPTLLPNTAGWMGPPSASFTSYSCQFPSTAPSGGQVLSCGTPNGSGVSTGSWVSASGGSVQYGYLTASMTAQTTATPTAITNMAWNITANKNYTLTCEVPVTFVASATIAFDLNGPGTPTSYTLEADVPNSAGALNEILTSAAAAWATATGGSGAPGAATKTVHVHGQIQNGSTSSGTQLQLRTIANGSNSITVLKDAACTLAQTN